MAKIFYDHLVVIDEVTTLLDSLDTESRNEIISLIDQTLHHHILDTILTHLPKEHHETFLERFHKAPHDPELLVFLKEYAVVDIEKAISEKAKKVKKSLLSEIKKSKHRPSH